MSDIQRYATSEMYNTRETCMGKQYDGEWVKYSDHKKAIEAKDKEIRGLSNLLIGLGECDGDAKELMYRQQTHIVMLKKQNDFLTKFLEVSDMVEAAQNWIALNSGGGSND